MKILLLVFSAVTFFMVKPSDASTMPDNAQNLIAYIKGIYITATAGDAYVILDNSQPITTAGSPGVTLQLATKTDFMLYIGNASTSASARTVIATLLAAKASNDLMILSVASSAVTGGYNNLSACMPKQ